MHVEDLIVLGRTVPEESRKYGQKVCMAGYSAENNQFLRVYPLLVPVGGDADSNGFRARHRYVSISSEILRIPDPVVASCG